MNWRDPDEPMEDVIAALDRAVGEPGFHPVAVYAVGLFRDADEETRFAVNGRIAIPQEEQTTSMGQVVGNFMRHLAGLLIDDAEG